MKLIQFHMMCCTPDNEAITMQFGRLDPHKPPVTTTQTDLLWTYPYFSVEL